MPIINPNRPTLGLKATALRRLFWPRQSEPLVQPSLPKPEPEPMPPLPYNDITRMAAQDIAPESEQHVAPTPRAIAPLRRPAAPDLGAAFMAGGGYGSRTAGHAQGEARRKWEDETAKVDQANAQLFADAQINEPELARQKHQAGLFAERGKVAEDVRTGAGKSNEKLDELAFWGLPQAAQMRADVQMAEDAKSANALKNLLGVANVNNQASMDRLAVQGQQAKDVANITGGYGVQAAGARANQQAETQRNIDRRQQTNARAISDRQARGAMNADLLKRATAAEKTSGGDWWDNLLQRPTSAQEAAALRAQMQAEPEIPDSPEDIAAELFNARPGASPEELAQHLRSAGMERSQILAVVSAYQQLGQGR